MSIPSSPLDPPAKRCTKCGESRPPAQFRSHPQARDGLQSWCKPCEVAYQAAYRKQHPKSNSEYVKRWKAKNPEKAAAHRAAYQKRNPAKVAEYTRRWRERNPDKAREHSKEAAQRYNERNPGYRAAYRRANIDRDRARMRIYRRANKDKIKAIAHNRRARELSAPGRVSEEQIAARWDYYGGLCWVCGAAATAIDHVVPLSRGGSNWPANLRPACKSCNSAKNNRDWRKFLISRAREG